MTPGSRYVAARLITLKGKTYKPGEPIDSALKGLPDWKVGQFLNQRLIRPSMAGVPPK